MPQSSSFALQTSITEALTGDPAVVGLLGGAKVFDHVPRNAAFPFVTFGQSLARDYATALGEAEEHILTLHVWSEGGRREEAYDLIAAVRRVLHDAPLSLADHKLVNLRQEFSDARREPERESWHGIIRYRAVTEPE
jgi:hypothetical protein